jgi:hypothetical protein
MLLLGKCDQFFLKVPKPVWPFKSKLTKEFVWLLLMLSVSLGPKVITLSGFHCSI